MRTETILKLYNTLVLPTFLYGSENWTLTALQRRRIEAAEMKVLRPLAGYTLYDHKTNDYICRELWITGILDKIDEYRWNWLSHLQRMPQNQIPLKSYHYRPQARRTIGRPKKRCRDQLLLWRRNGSKGPILDVYDDEQYFKLIGTLKYFSYLCLPFHLKEKFIFIFIQLNTHWNLSKMIKVVEMDRQTFYTHCIMRRNNISVCFIKGFYGKTSTRKETT